MSIDMNQNEYIVLREYARMAAGGEYLTNAKLAEKLGADLSTLKPILDALRSKGLLSGTRKVSITPVGSETFRAAQDLLIKKATEESSPAVDSSPAAVSAVPVEAVSHSRDPRKLSDIVAENLHVDADKLWEVIRNNVISWNKEYEDAPSNAEIMQVMTVMHKYQLDPFIKQIYAFRHKNRLQITVAMDGWVAIANRNPDYEGVEYEFPEMAEMIERGDKMCWPWVKATCHVRGRKPTVVYAFLDEWWVPGKPGKGPSNWELYPTHRLKMKAFTLALREALGIALYDEVDAEQFFRADVVEETRIEANTASPEQLLSEVIEASEPLGLPGQEDAPGLELTGTEKDEPGLGDMEEEAI